MRILRVVLTAAALVVGAWFVLGWVQARDTGQATAALSGSQSLSSGRVAQVRSWLDSAGTLNPDRTVELLRAHLAITQHQYPAARRMLGSVVRAEPENVFAWQELAVLAGLTHNLPLVASTGRHIAQLVPKIG